MDFNAHTVDSLTCLRLPNMPVVQLQIGSDSFINNAMKNGNTHAHKDNTHESAVHACAGTLKGKMQEAIAVGG